MVYGNFRELSFTLLDIDLTVLADCNQVVLENVPATLPDVHYTFGAAQVIVTFPLITAEYPNCVVLHTMRI